MALCVYDAWYWGRSAWVLGQLCCFSIDPVELDAHVVAPFVEQIRRRYDQVSIAFCVV
jgi:hypothetical protein